MHRQIATIIAAVVAVLLLASVSQARPQQGSGAKLFLHEYKIPVPASKVHKQSSSTKRQKADVIVAEWLAWVALGNKVQHSGGCVEVACGVVDVEASGRKKRDLLRAMVEKAASLAENNNVPEWSEVARAEQSKMKSTAKEK